MTIFKKIAIGISGGVDSAVAAFLLKSRGYDVHGVFMKNWDSFNEMGVCMTEKDYLDAQIVCKKLDIPLTQVNFVKQYWNEVFVHFLRDYELGFTPNPDIMCNRKVKFKCFYDYCRKTLQADAIATGHYANTSFGPYLENYQEGVSVKLLRPFDKFKDQTFFLSQVEQKPFRRTMFPLAPYEKCTVRDIAKKEGLLNVASKKDSTGICFVGRRHWKKFISQYVGSKPGLFIDIDTGKVVGKHKGFHEWTLGQRCSLGGNSIPYFVLRKNADDNSIFVVSDTNHPLLHSNIVITDRPNWIYEEPAVLRNNGVFKCFFRFQHTKPLVNCSMMYTNNSTVLILDEALRSITHGQFANLYNDEECYGSARIINLGPSLHFLKKS